MWGGLTSPQHQLAWYHYLGISYPADVHWWHHCCCGHQLKVPVPQLIPTKPVQRPPVPALPALWRECCFLFLQELPAPEPLLPGTSTGPESEGTQASWISYFPHCSYLSLRIMYQVASKVTFLFTPGPSSMNQFCSPHLSSSRVYSSLETHDLSCKQTPPPPDIPDTSEYKGKHWLGPDWDSFCYIYYHYCYYSIIMLMMMMIMVMMMMMNWGPLVTVTIYQTIFWGKIRSTHFFYLIHPI